MQPPSATLVSIQVGQPRTMQGLGGEWTSAIYKSAVTGPVWLAASNLAGDRQADLNVHGGPDKAVHAYAAGHYPAWRAELSRPDLGYGGFGENFTVEGVAEETICIGDIFEVGEALVQVSQPRGPCWKLARRWGVPDMVERVLASGRTGWYFRVLREGQVAAGVSLTLVESPYPEWTVARANEVKNSRQVEAPTLAALAACPALAEAWRGSLRKRIASTQNLH